MCLVYRVIVQLPESNRAYQCNNNNNVLTKSTENVEVYVSILTAVIVPVLIVRAAVLNINKIHYFRHNSVGFEEQYSLVISFEIRP